MKQTKRLIAVKNNQGAAVRIRPRPVNPASQAPKCSPQDANFKSVKKKVAVARRGLATITRAASSAKQLEKDSFSRWNTYGLTGPQIERWLAAWGDYFEELKCNACKIYMLTFEFGKLAEGEKRRLAIMSDEIDRFYRTLATRAVKRPKSANGREMLPPMIACPDLPIRKNKKRKSWELKFYRNDGLHFHSVVAVKPGSQVRLKRHLRDDKNVYVRRGKALVSVHATRIRNNVPRAVDYVLKQVKRGRFSMDDILLFPRSISELSERRNKGGRGR